MQLPGLDFELQRRGWSVDELSTRSGAAWITCRRAVAGRDVAPRSVKKIVAALHAAPPDPIIDRLLGNSERMAAVTIMSGRVEEDNSTGIRLLVDVRRVFGERDRIPSAELCSALNKLEESSWGGWHAGGGLTTRDLARLLRPYAVRPRTIRFGEATLNGYAREDFADSWRRYLREPNPPQDARRVGPSATEDEFELSVQALIEDDPDLQDLLTDDDFAHAMESV